MALDSASRSELELFPGWQGEAVLVDISRLSASVAKTGLVLRGAFHPVPTDQVPALDDGRPVGTLVLLGSIGRSLWPHFAASAEHQDGAADALDRWSKRVIDDLAGQLDGTAFYPFGGPPFRPFVAWAKRAEDLRESPLGILIHPEHGLWHAYRGALALAATLALPPRLDRPRPCDSCVGQPCLRACPVAAFGSSGYDVAACSGFLDGPQGHSCLGAGCQARRSCPIGQDLCYDPVQATFHMTAFQAARRGTRAK